MPQEGSNSCCTAFRNYSNYDNRMLIEYLSAFQNHFELYAYGRFLRSSIFQYGNTKTPGRNLRLFSPILGIALLAAIVDLGAPLNYHSILGAGFYTFIYILARAFGKYFGAMSGAKITHMPDTVRKYLGLTLLPHSGVSLVFAGIICSTLSSLPQLVQILQGTIAAAAVINEFIAVIAAKKGFELADEI